MSDSIKLHTMDLFSRFFQENQEKFLTFAYSYLRDKAEAEDVLMESMIALWENRNRWEEGSNLHALLLTIIKNKSLNLLEHKKIRLQAEENINSHNQRELNLYNPQIQISAESETKRSIFREKDKTKRSKKESAQHSKSRNKSFVMTSVSAL